MPFLRGGKAHAPGVFTKYDLKIYLISASDLSSPEYRFGDFTKSLVRGNSASLAKVYLNVRVGSWSKTTFPPLLATAEKNVDLSGLHRPISRAPPQPLTLK